MLSLVAKTMCGRIQSCLKPEEEGHVLWSPSRWKSASSIAQSVTCLTTDARLTADPGVASSITARSHTFVEIEHEIMSTVILLIPSTDSFEKGPQGFWGSGENVHLFSGSLGALVIIFRDLGSKLIVLGI